MFGIRTGFELEEGRDLVVPLVFPVARRRGTVPVLVVRRWLLEDNVQDNAQGERQCEGFESNTLPPVCKHPLVACGPKPPPPVLAHGGVLAQGGKVKGKR